MRHPDKDEADFYVRWMIPDALDGMPYSPSDEECYYRGSGFDIEEGVLSIYGDDRRVRLVFAPGIWLSVMVLDNEDEGDG